MSHFTSIKTRFQNLTYLEEALNRLAIDYRLQKKTIVDSTNSNTSLIIPQSNGYDIEFAWDGEQYQIVTDLSFWQQSSPIVSFVDKVAQQYAAAVIIGESKKMGFQAINYNKNSDGSNTLVLERWNH